MTVTLTRIIFLLLSTTLFTLYTTTTGFTATNALIGVGIGTAVSLLLITAEYQLRKFTLKELNTTTLGIFLGYLLGQVFLLVTNAAIDLSTTPISEATTQLLNVVVVLFCVYLGTTFVQRGSEEFHVSIPFVKFQSTSDKKKDILLDLSLISDPRLIDLCSSGLVNNHLVIPKFTLKELYNLLEKGDESMRHKARRALDVIRKLESIPNLNLKHTDTDFPEIKDHVEKIVRLARLTDASVITADINRIQQSSIEGIVIINIHALANALKPITQNGEELTIKIQRYGKEARQGVGYLEDGTMVVVNGGAEYIGEMIKAKVLSVKHTSSGRMIFCNAPDEEEEDEIPTISTQQASQYFTV